MTPVDGIDHLGIQNIETLGVQKSGALRCSLVSLLVIYTALLRISDLSDHPSDQ